MNAGEFLLSLLNGGLGNLAAYLAAHVLLCLVPAFYIAGAMTALIPRESVTRFLGRSAPKWIAYPGAALAGSVLAVCSCTIVPLFAGIYKKGAGIARNAVHFPAFQRIDQRVLQGILGEHEISKLADQGREHAPVLFAERFLDL